MEAGTVELLDKERFLMGDTLGLPLRGRPVNVKSWAWGGFRARVPFPEKLEEFGLRETPDSPSTSNRPFVQRSNRIEAG